MDAAARPAGFDQAVEVMNEERAHHIVTQEPPGCRCGCGWAYDPSAPLSWAAHVEGSILTALLAERVEGSDVPLIIMGSELREIAPDGTWRARFLPTAYAPDVAVYVLAPSVRARIEGES